MRTRIAEKGMDRELTDQIHALNSLIARARQQLREAPMLSAERREELHRRSDHHAAAGPDVPQPPGPS